MLHDTAQWCDFCVYTSKGVVVERISPDEHWQEVDHILPELIDPQHKPSHYL